MHLNCLRRKSYLKQCDSIWMRRRCLERGGGAICDGERICWPQKWWWEKLQLMARIEVQTWRVGILFFFFLMVKLYNLSCLTLSNAITVPEFTGIIPYPFPLPAPFSCQRLSLCSCWRHGRPSFFLHRACGTFNQNCGFPYLCQVIRPAEYSSHSWAYLFYSSLALSTDYQAQQNERRGGGAHSTLSSPGQTVSQPTRVLHQS